MPQIAQQDYIYIKPNGETPWYDDAATLAELRRAVDRGIILDCVIVDDDGTQNKILGVFEYNKVVMVSSEHLRLQAASLDYTLVQYEGLAAIQQGLIEAQGGGTVPMPVLSEDAGRLRDDDYGFYILVEGHFLMVSADDDNKLLQLSLGEIAPDNVKKITITWEDAQKLIGLQLA